MGTLVSVNSANGKRVISSIKWLTISIFLKLAKRGLLAFWPLARVNFFLAKIFALFIPKIILEKNNLFVHQSIALQLWQSGKIKKNNFQLWMDYLPISETQKRLNQSPWPGETKDFRVERTLIESENEMIESAEKIFTNHRLIKKFVPRAELNSLQMPRFLIKPGINLNTILFPGPHKDREGSQEVYAAAEELNLKVHLYTGNLNEIPWYSILALVHPTVFESRRTVHLETLNKGIPLVVSDGLGFTETHSIFLVDLWQKDQIVQKLKTIKNLRQI